MSICTTSGLFLLPASTMAKFLIIVFVIHVSKMENRRDWVLHARNHIMKDYVPLECFTFQLQVKLLERYSWSQRYTKFCKAKTKQYQQNAEIL